MWFSCRFSILFVCKSQQAGRAAHVFVLALAQHGGGAAHFLIQRARDALVDQAAQIVRPDRAQLQAGMAADVLRKPSTLMS